MPQILDVHLYVVGNFLSESIARGQHIELGERIDMTYDSWNVKEVIKSEMKQRKGHTVISRKSNTANGLSFTHDLLVCTDNDTRHEIRRLVRNHVDESVSLKELDYCPGRIQTSRVVTA